MRPHCFDGKVKVPTMRKALLPPTIVLAGLCCCLVAEEATVAEPPEQTPQVAGTGPGVAQRFAGMGPHRRTITTSSSAAQDYFNQGLAWAQAFNHDEAIRSFLVAAELDPECAMAWWGVAYCEGPNYNDEVMTEARSKAAWYALQNAVARIEHTCPVERALIEALSHRYANPWPDDRTPLEQAYADAMADVWRRYPDDADAGTLYAEALMVQKPWKLYTLDQQPVEGTAEILAVLSRVLKIEPDHPGANHLWIHAVEPSARPSDGLEAARRLGSLVPASGHLLHMPCHIYVEDGPMARCHRPERQGAGSGREIPGAVAQARLAASVYGS